MELRSKVILAGVAALALGACGVESLVDVATETAALTSAECDAQTAGAAVTTCFDTFRTCRSAAGAVEADCKAALDACLPEGVPARARHGGGGPGHGDGGCHGGGGEGHRGPPPGGAFGHPPGARDGGPGSGPGGRHGRGGGAGRPGRGPIGVDDAAVEACRTTVQSCIATGTDEQTCRDAARTCIHDAFAAALAARCQELTDACTANGQTDCASLAERCARGPATAPEGVCEAPEPIAP